MITVFLRFYEELNDFLPLEHQKVRFQRKLKQSPSVKDLIESCGVPHPEVDLILINGESVGFDHRISNRDDISIYPVFESFDISDVKRLQARPLRQLQFVADGNLGKLARKMRLLGLDVAFDASAAKDDLLQTMINDNRVILTTNRGLLMRKIVERGYCVRSDNPTIQTREVIRRFDLVNVISPFTRCVCCNAVLKSVNKEEVLEYLKADTRKFYDAFTQCPECRKVYWYGSHTVRIQKFVEWIRKDFSV
ncbi:MAG: Mut7-C ubiquitin/RNAse domain-containing protein [Proteobacteria bacterium]|nr:Mut7-C ubiquitin/RNAse domain-containing protein [Pseudomonadota bacterium]